MMSYPIIHFSKISQLPQLIKAWGVVVITDVFSDMESDFYCSRIVSQFEKICDFNKNDIQSTWIPQNLPPQTRPGMFQALVSNLPTVWQVRSDPRIYQIFDICYQSFLSKKSDYIVSADGINLKPGTIGPFNTEKSRDWAHLDQTNLCWSVFKCIQGQAVLSNSSASFVASPKSHLVFREIIGNEDGSNDLSNFRKIKDINSAKKMVEDVGGSWQIPITAPKGSFIIWLSSVVHSAMLQTKSVNPLPDDPFYGWRCVLYISYRPKDDFSKSQLDKKIKYLKENRVMNHWGTKVFKKDPAKTRFNQTQYSKKVANLVENPRQVYKIFPLKLHPFALKLCGID